MHYLILGENLSQNKGEATLHSFLSLFAFFLHRDISDKNENSAIGVW